MENLNSLLSNEIDYLQALRYAQPLPQIPPPVIIPQVAPVLSSGFKIRPLYILLGIGAGLWAFIFVREYLTRKKESNSNGSRY